MKTKTLKRISLLIATFMLLFVSLILTSCDEKDIEKFASITDANNFALEIAKDYAQNHSSEKFVDTTFTTSIIKDSTYTTDVEYKENPTDTETIKEQMTGHEIVDTISTISIKNMEDNLLAIQIKNTQSRLTDDYSVDDETMALKHEKTNSKTITVLTYYAEKINDTYTYRQATNITKYEEDEVVNTLNKCYVYETYDDFIDALDSVINCINSRIINSAIFGIFDEDIYVTYLFGTATAKKDGKNYVLNASRSYFEFEEGAVIEYEQGYSLSLNNNKTATIKISRDTTQNLDKILTVDNCSFSYGSTIDLPTSLENYTTTDTTTSYYKFIPHSIIAPIS